MSRIVVHRVAARWQDRARDYRVLVDGRERAVVGNDASASVEVEPGTYTVEMKLDWCRAPALRGVVGPDETVHLECGPNSSPILVLVYVTFLRDRYIWLREIRRSRF